MQDPSSRWHEDQQVFEAKLQWLPQHLEEWTSDLRNQHQRVRSTIRGYEHAIRSFCTYLTDGRYGCTMSGGLVCAGTDHSI
jgi:hypothetical protein